MLKETPRSLRLFFGILAFLYAIMFAGAVSEVTILVLKKAEFHLSVLFVAQTLYKLAVAVAFGFVVAKFAYLIRENPKGIKRVVHLNFWGSIVFVVIYLLRGTPPNYLGGIISLIVYLYLLNSVDRISKELLEPKTA